jgi:hypothetical protein
MRHGPVLGSNPVPINIQQAMQTRKARHPCRAEACSIPSDAAPRRAASCLVRLDPTRLGAHERTQAFGRVPSACRGLRSAWMKPSLGAAPLSGAAASNALPSLEPPTRADGARASWARPASPGHSAARLPAPAGLAARSNPSTAALGSNPARTRASRVRRPTGASRRGAAVMRARRVTVPRAPLSSSAVIGALRDIGKP